jgi:methyl-accepting chemotaxis protein
MNILSKLKLRLTGRIMVSVVGAIFVMMLLILLIIGISSTKQAKKAGIELAESQSQEVASNVVLYLNQAVEGLNTLSSSALALRNSKTATRADFNNVLNECLIHNKSYLAIWHMWEPNAFDQKDAIYNKDQLYKDCNGLFNVSIYRDGENYNLEKGTLDQYEEDYYTIAKQTGKLAVLEPYMYSYTGQTNDSVYETSICIPVLINNKVNGVIGIDISLETLKDIISGHKLYETGFSAIISNELQIAAHPNSELRGKNLSEIIVDKNKLDEARNAIAKGNTYAVIDISNDSQEEVLRCFTPIKVGESKTPWAVMVEVPMGEVSAEANRLIGFIATVGFVSMLIILLIVYVIARSVVKPIKESADFAREIAKGNLDALVPRSTNDDEIADMAKSMQEMVTKLKEIVSNIWVSAENIFSASQHLNQTSFELSEGANEQAASTEEVSSSMEQMVGNINQNTDNSRQTEIIAVKAASDIESGSKAVITTVDAMKQIAEKISIIGVIAEKTDVLAINAAIEAARAGEHGKGFAVVASEIRKLAERSQNAARQIDELSKSSVKIADKSGEELLRIVPDIQRTSLLVQEITAGSMEQNTGAEQINNALIQLNTITQRNAAASEEMASSSEELFAQAEQLKHTVSYYKSAQLKKTMTTQNKIILKTPSNPKAEQSNNILGKDFKSSSSNDDNEKLFENF